MELMRSASTHGFPLEKHLVSVVRREIAKEMVPPRSTLHGKFIGMPVGAIAPDLLLVVGRRNAKKSKLKAKPSLFECAVLAEVMKRGPVSSETISSALFSRNSSVERAVLKLRRWKLLHTEPNGLLRASSTAFPASLKVISVEAKLLRWTEAIRQATDYLKFSNAAYVALPDEVILRSNRVKAACVEAGVGLIAVTTSRIRIICLARKTKPGSAERLWVISKAMSGPEHHARSLTV
jgi:hypothetical protein